MNSNKKYVKTDSFDVVYTFTDTRGVLKLFYVTFRLKCWLNSSINFSFDYSTGNIHCWEDQYKLNERADEWSGRLAYDSAQGNSDPWGWFLQLSKLIHLS